MVLSSGKSETKDSLSSLDMCNDLQMTNSNLTGFSWRLCHYNTNSSLILPHKNGTIDDAVSQHWVLAVSFLQEMPGVIVSEDGVARG